MTSMLAPAKPAAASSTLPLVSIVVPAFNAEATLRESLESILTQTYPSVEVLVMDDASTDGTSTIIASFGERLGSYRQPANRGNYPNVNDGIARATGKYVAVYHADDVYDPRIVEREVAYLEAHTEVGAVFCEDIFIDPEGHEVGRLELPIEVRGERPLDYRKVLNTLLANKNRFLRCPSSMVRRSVYEIVGPYRNAEYGIASDLDMWLRIARRHPLGILEEHLFRYRRGHGSWSDRYYKLRTEPERYFEIMDRQLQEGGRELADPAALAAYEAYRAEDRLMRAAAHYILDQPAAAREVLAKVRVAQIVASPRVRRARLLVLLAMLRLMTRFPRVPVLANALYRRWYANGRLK